MWKSPIPLAMTAMQQQQVDQDILRGRGPNLLLVQTFSERTVLESELEFPSMCGNVTTNVFVQFPCSVSCLSFHLRRTCLSLQFIVCLFCLSTVVCAQLPQCTHISQPCVHVAQAQGCVVRIKTRSSPCHPCLHLRIPLALTQHL